MYHWIFGDGFCRVEVGRMGRRGDGGMEGRWEGGVKGGRWEGGVKGGRWLEWRGPPVIRINN